MIVSPHPVSPYSLAVVLRCLAKINTVNSSYKNTVYRNTSLIGTLLTGPIYISVLSFAHGPTLLIGTLFGRSLECSYKRS
jgi:hypothetical protein